MLEISLVVPFFNEEKILSEKINEIHKYLKKNFKDFELILVDDGSVDSSNQIAKSTIANLNNVSLITSKVNMGRWNAIRKGLQEAKGKIQGYLDVDLEIKLEYIPPALKILNAADIVIASKFASGAKVQTPALRKISSFFFNLLVNLILHTGLTDHQAGFKFFRKEVLDNILKLSQQDGWLWDIEILYLAKKKRYTVVEIPIKIRYGYRNIRSTFLFDFIKMPFFVLELKRKVDKIK